MEIYLDYQSTTPCDPRVLDKMIPFFSRKFWNPHSEHSFGDIAFDAVEEARFNIADIISANPHDIIFTSGATEANNLAIKGFIGFYKNRKIVTSSIEHKCVMNSCKRLEKQNTIVEYLPVNKNGIIDINLLEASIAKDKALVSLMFVNNEIGTISPIAEIGSICRKHDAYFHTDAAQALGKVEINVDSLMIDLMSMSSHKIYGPKGIGALYRRSSGANRVNLVPMMDGGGQEHGLRSGTLPVPLCVGFGEACKIAKEEMNKNNNHILTMQKIFLEKITSSLQDVHINGDMMHRIAGNLSISFKGVEAEALIFGLKTIAVSSGSACSSDRLEPSYVLKSIGLSDDLINCSIRISVGKWTTLEEVNFAADAIIKTVGKLRKISSLI